MRGSLHCAAHGETVNSFGRDDGALGLGTATTTAGVFCRACEKLSFMPFSGTLETVTPSLQEESRLAALRRYSILDSLPEQGYEDATALAAIICGTPISLVSLVDADRQWFKSEHGLGARQTGRAESFCAHTLETATTLIVEDALLDERFVDNPLVVGDPRIRFYAGAPVVDPSGFVLGTVCVIDTEPRVLSAEQVAALEALARQVMALMELRLKIAVNEKAADAMRTVEKLAAVGRLASTMAHEINNPLQSMTNLLYMAESSGERSDQLSYLKQSQDELARVSHIVTQTLRFHKQSDRAVPVMLGEVVESVLLLFRTRMGHAAVSVEVDDRQMKPLRCYGSDVRQVLANLIGNAMDAVNGGAGTKILVRIRDGANGVRLTVADDGPGMDAATQARLFEPFFSTKGARGTGLGLWVSRGILEKHGASVRVKSRVGFGTVFGLYFPFENDCGE
jgi:two-component system, NtrC family, sensor kinase